MKRALLLFACLTPCWLPSITAQRPLPAAIDAIDLRIIEVLPKPSDETQTELIVLKR